MAAGPALWPWLAVAAAGALHGLNPVAGWGIVAWRGRARGSQPGLRALWPIAAGNHLAAMLATTAAASGVAARVLRQLRAQ